MMRVPTAVMAPMNPGLRGGVGQGRPVFRWSALAVVLSSLGLGGGCSGYQAGSFGYLMTTFDGERATVGCLDVAVAREPDLEGAAVLKYSFGNRCDGPETIDLGSVAVRGRTASGAEVVLVPEDPEGEIHPLALDGHIVGHESLAYASAFASSEPLVQICVDLASIGHGAAPSWHCYASARQASPLAPAAPEPEPESNANPVALAEVIP